MLFATQALLPFHQDNGMEITLNLILFVFEDWEGMGNFLSTLPYHYQDSSSFRVGKTKYNELPWRYDLHHIT